RLPRPLPSPGLKCSKALYCNGPGLAFCAGAVWVIPTVCRIMMLHSENSYVVPVVRNLEAYLVSSPGIGVGFQEVKSGRLVEADARPGADFATERGIHEPAVDIGETWDFIDVSSINERHYIFVSGTTGGRSGMFNVVLPGSRWRLSCKVGSHGVRGQPFGHRCGP